MISKSNDFTVFPTIWNNVEKHFLKHFHLPDFSEGLRCCRLSECVVSKYNFCGCMWKHLLDFWSKTFSLCFYGVPSLYILHVLIIKDHRSVEKYIYVNVELVNNSDKHGLVGSEIDFFIWWWRKCSCIFKGGSCEVHMGSMWCNFDTLIHKKYVAC